METQVQKIISPQTSSSERFESYKFLIQFVQENGITAKILNDFNSLLNLIKQDMKSEEINLSLECLHLVGLFLRSDVIVNVIDEENLGAVIDDLCTVIMKSQEKTVCIRALWSLAKLKVPLVVWTSKLDTIMEIIQQPQPGDPKQTSGSYELEIIRVLHRLLLELPEQMATRTAFWSRRLYLATVSPVPKVRESSLRVLETFWSVIQKEQTHSSLVILVEDLKEKLVPGMLKMFKERQEIPSLKLWRLLLQILGKALHQGASLINTLLVIVEKGFKSANPEVKVEAFKSWHELIRNFGSEIEVLANPKRLRLVMQPLKANNARTELVANSKFKVWWFLIAALGSKLNLNMESVLHPFLQFCFGLEETNGNQSNQSLNTSNSSSQSSETLQRMSLSTNNNSRSSPQKYALFHRSACEALAVILDHKSDIPINKPSFIVDELPFTILEPSQKFLHHCKILLTSLRKGVIGLGNEKRNLHLQLYLMHKAVTYLKINADGENKKEFSEALSLLLFTFDEIVKNDSLSPDVILKLLEVSTLIPKKVLHSSAYTIEEASVMSGTPSLFLIKLLFRNPLLALSSTERFGSIFQKLISGDVDSTVDTLSFTELVIKTIDSASVEIAHSDTLFSLWNIVATNLLEKIEVTKEINQGDSLEHDFGCIYAALLFPINHLYRKPLLQSSIKMLNATWFNLCKKLGTLKDFVSKVPVNIWCEEFSLKILNNIPDDSFKISLMQENLSNLLLVMISLVDFSSVDKLFADGDLNENWLKPKSKPLGFVSSFIILYNKLVSAVVSSEKELPEKTQLNVQTFCKTIVSLAKVANILFTKITFSHCLEPLLSQMKSSVSSIFTIAEKLKIVPNEVLKEMWDGCVDSIKNKYEGLDDSVYNEFFRLVCPLLEATLNYSSATIREKTSDLWHQTFMLSPARLDLPDSFKEVFRHHDCSVPETGRQVATAIEELVRLSQALEADRTEMANEPSAVKSPIFQTKKHGLEADDFSPEPKRRRMNDQEVSPNVRNVESEISNLSEIAQIEQIVSSPSLKIIEIDKSVESMPQDATSDGFSTSFKQPIESDVSNSADQKIIEIIPKQSEESTDVEMEDRSEPKAISNGEKLALPVDNDDDIIPSSQSIESFMESYDGFGRKSKTEDPVTSPKSAKETTRHRARRSSRFLTEKSISETGGTGDVDKSRDSDKPSTPSIAAGKRRRKSSHHVREEFDEESVKPVSKQNEKEVPEEKKKSKTARKSFQSPPFRFDQEIGLSSTSTRSTRKSREPENSGKDSILQTARRQLQQRLNQSDLFITKSQSEFNDGIKPMDVDHGNASTPVSRFENLVKSPILHDARTEKSATSTSSSDLFLQESVTKKLDFNDSLEEGEILSPNRSPKKEIESCFESKSEYIDASFVSVAEEEIRNTSPDLNTIGSELTVGSEVVVNVSTEEKENDMYVTAMQLDQSNSELMDQSSSRNDVQPQAVTNVSTKRELRSDSIRNELSARRNTKSSTDVPLRGEERVSFSPQRYTKTYSKGTPVVDNVPKQDPVLNNAMMQRVVGSRGWKILEAAKRQNLSNYEKVKYETKKSSPEKFQERRTWDFLKSPSPDLTLSPTRTPEKANIFKKGTLSSPYGSPSVGILKKQIKRLSVPYGDSPSTRIQRRVSFADPLVQKPSEVQNKGEQKDLNGSKQSTSQQDSISKPATEVSSESLSVSEKQIPLEPETITKCNEEQPEVENVIESSQIVSSHLDVTTATEIVSSVEEIGAITEIDSAIMAVELLHENSESKNEQFNGITEEIAVDKSVESNQRDAITVIEEEEHCQLNLSSEVPEIQMEVSVPIDSVDNQVTAKQDGVAVHVVGESGDGNESLLNKTVENFDSVLLDVSRDLSKFTVENLSQLPHARLIRIQHQLLNASTVVSNVLINQTETG